MRQSVKLFTDVYMLVYVCANILLFFLFTELIPVYVCSDCSSLSFFLYILPGARFRALSAGVHCTLRVAG